MPCHYVKYLLVNYTLYYIVLFVCITGVESNDKTVHYISHKNDFKVTESNRVCSKHFLLFLILLNMIQRKES